MRTTRFVHRTASLALASVAVTTAANAGIVIDSFDSVGQVALAGGSLVATAVDSGAVTSAANGLIAPVANSRNNRVARAGWTSTADSGFSTADKSNRYSSTIIDTASGTANFNFGGKLDGATNSLTYNSAVGSSMDFASYGYGIGLSGILAGSTGISDPYFQGLTLDLVLTDANGIQANYTFFGSSGSAFDGLNGNLVANFTDFVTLNPGEVIDLSRISSFAVNFEYQNNTFGASTPDVVGTYQLSSISIVPAPGALALLAAAGLVGMRRRR
jgi:uncharacterized protein (TIGR03382 family)